MQAFSEISMFWHGPALSRKEVLSIRSFQAHGHRVCLYVYEPVRGVPPEVDIRDAREVLAADQLFLHNRSGSVATFTDWFRYRLLNLRGGLWCDADIVCLRPMKYADPLVLGWQDPYVISGAVLGAPAGHELVALLDAGCQHPNRSMPYDPLRVRWRKLRRRLLRNTDRGRMRWGESGPHALTGAVRYLHYVERCLPPSEFYPIPLDRWESIFTADGATERDLQQACAVHLWNEMQRRQPGFDSNAKYPESSLFERLWRRYC